MGGGEEKQVTLCAIPTQTGTAHVASVVGSPHTHSAHVHTAYAQAVSLVASPGISSLHYLVFFDT